MQNFLPLWTCLPLCDYPNLVNLALSLSGKCLEIQYVGKARQALTTGSDSQWMYRNEFVKVK